MLLDVADDLRRSRVTVLLRGLLVVPHAMWSTVWTFAVLPLVPFVWLTALFSGRVDDDVHRFLGRWLRYQLHVNAYALLLANPYPRYAGRRGQYPIDLVLPPPERQSRWSVAMRALLALPAVAFASAFAMVATAVALAAWFVALALGRVPQGMRDLGAYCVRYVAQTAAYVLLLTPRRPVLAGGTTGDAAPTDDQALTSWRNR